MENPFTQAQQRYQQLRALRDSGQMHPQQFLTEVERLRWQDTHGVWWLIDPNGVLLSYDGQRWTPSQPPQPMSYAQPAPEQMARAQPVATPAVHPMSPHPSSAPPVTQSGSVLRAVSPILAILPAMLCGGAWFLYTFIGVFKYEGLRGIDFVTPLIVGGLPILFWILKKPLDQLLMPLRPVIVSVPRALRLGICIGIPLFLGCGCSMLSRTGYFMLSLSALVSVLTAAVLMRY